MARGYPRFLFSNPKNTKSEGPFITHMLFPRKLYMIEWEFIHDDAHATLHEIKKWGDDCSEEDSQEVYKQAFYWLKSKIKAKEIVCRITREDRIEKLMRALTQKRSAD